MNDEQKNTTMVLFDTNIIIEIYRGNYIVRSELEKIGIYNIVVSDVTRAELFYGAINKIELQKISKDLNKIKTLHIDPSISIMAVNLVEKYCLSHKTDLEDALIAATAIINNIELYTLNVKDFGFIPDLKLYQPK